MRVARKIAVRVLADIVVLFARGVGGIDMNRRVGEIAQAVQQLVADAFRDIVAFFDRQSLIDRDIELRVHAVAEPADANLAYASHASNMAGRVLDLSDNLRVDAVKQPADNRFAGLPNDSENHNRYEQTDGGIG